MTYWNLKEQNLGRRSWHLRGKPGSTNIYMSKSNCTFEVSSLMLDRSERENQSENVTNLEVGAG